MTPTTTIYIARHGETEFNRDNLLQGQTDSPLTASGLQQAEALGAKLKHIHFDAIFSSDLLRAHRTAEIVTLEKKLAITTSNLLREKSYGHLEGKKYKEFEEKYQILWDEYEKLGKANKYTFKLHESMESDEEVASRFLIFLREVAISHLGKTILIVSHGGAIKVLLVHLGFATYEELPPGAVGNCGYIKLESDGVDFFVKETENIKIVR